MVFGAFFTFFTNSIHEYCIYVISTPYSLSLLYFFLCLSTPILVTDSHNLFFITVLLLFPPVMNRTFVPQRGGRSGVCF